MPLMQDIFQSRDSFRMWKDILIHSTFPALLNAVFKGVKTSLQYIHKSKQE